MRASVGVGEYLQFTGAIAKAEWAEHHADIAACANGNARWATIHLQEVARRLNRGDRHRQSTDIGDGDQLRRRGAGKYRVAITHCRYGEFGDRSRRESAIAGKCNCIRPDARGACRATAIAGDIQLRSFGARRCRREGNVETAARARRDRRAGIAREKQGRIGAGNRDAADVEGGAARVIDEKPLRAGRRDDLIAEIKRTADTDLRHRCRDAIACQCHQMRAAGSVVGNRDLASRRCNRARRIRDANLARVAWRQTRGAVSRNRNAAEWRRDTDGRKCQRGEAGVGNNHCKQRAATDGLATKVERARRKVDARHRHCGTGTRQRNHMRAAGSVAGDSDVTRQCGNRQRRESDVDVATAHRRQWRRE